MPSDRDSKRYPVCLGTNAFRLKYNIDLNSGFEQH